MQRLLGGKAGRLAACRARGIDPRPVVPRALPAIRVPRAGPERPRVRPTQVLGDKGYSSRAIRTWFRWRGIGHTVPERADQIRNRHRGGRPPAFDKHLYKRRNVVERCFNRLKQWRGIATRYDKTAECYQAAVTLASLLTWA
ncbi:transposase [Streptomyces sp. BV286]|uniref:transposase n=1 Tax=Streptomyces sp. BV286 TaxID=2849672 RepID=UPI0035A81C92